MVIEPVEDVLSYGIGRIRFDRGETSHSTGCVMRHWRLRHHIAATRPRRMLSSDVWSLHCPISEQVAPLRERERLRAGWVSETG